MFVGSVFVASPRWCTTALYFWPHINIEMRIMHKSLHGDYVLPQFLFLPQTASMVLSFSRWRCQLIHFQVLHKGDPFCLIPGLSHPLRVPANSFSPLQHQCCPPSLLLYLFEQIEWITFCESQPITIQLWGLKNTDKWVNTFLHVSLLWLSDITEFNWAENLFAPLCLKNVVFACFIYSHCSIFVVRDPEAVQK